MFIRTAETNPDLEGFRTEVRAFCEERLSAQTRRRHALGQHIDRDEYGAWMRQLGARGWLTGRWPEEHGGLGWSPEQFAVFSEELGRADAPPVVPFGVTMVGPVIYTFGTDAQKQRHLPGIARHDTWWCQGYSEPGAGSDLASLAEDPCGCARAIEYVVNGAEDLDQPSPTWADMDFLPGAHRQRACKKQEGISFLLIDMTSRRNHHATRSSAWTKAVTHLNEVEFNEVRVPVAESLIGEENKGWTYAKALFGSERAGVADVAEVSRVTMGGSASRRSRPRQENEPTACS